MSTVTSQFKHRYSIRKCNVCSTDLTAPESVIIVFRTGENDLSQQRLSCLSKTGLLIDSDDGVIEQGWHCDTMCQHCGHYLTDFEIL